MAEITNHTVNGGMSGATRLPSPFQRAFNRSIKSFSNPATDAKNKKNKTAGVKGFEKMNSRKAAGHSPKVIKTTLAIMKIRVMPTNFRVREISI